MHRLQGLLVLCALWLPVRDGAAAEPDRFRVSVPETVLTDVPVKFVKIEAIARDGRVDTSFNEQVYVTGVLYFAPKNGGNNSGPVVETSLGRFDNGVLLLETDYGKRQRVYITADEIVVAPDSRDRVVQPVRRLNRWWSIVPPLLAVILAIALRNVLLAMFAAVWSGAVILLYGDVFGGFARTLDTYVINEVVAKSDGSYANLQIILFTMFLGSMIGVMARSGGTAAIVNRLARFTKTREQGQVLTWILGFVIFFDDYANTLMVGGTMRPVTDRLRISREKLAFIVDSTAAPIAGLAIISTWVGVEVGYIQTTYEQIYAGSGADWNAYSTFLATIPYRFYPLHLLLFVLLIAYSGRDFSSMRRAELRALETGDLGAVDREIQTDQPDASSTGPHQRQLIRTALIPLLVLIAVIVGGLWSTGSAGLDRHNATADAQQQILKEGGGLPEEETQKRIEEKTLTNILKHADSNRVMFFAAFMASIAAVLAATIFRCLSIADAVEAWINGAKTMFTAILVLILAWAIATVCDADHLNTAGFLVELAAGHVSAAWIPTIAFLLAAAVSFATGSSFSTMGLLMPLFITMTHFLLASENDADPNHHLMLASIGAVLAGAIFGDHCSPISDTTVLSSAATGCDHLRHVATQFPYAMSVAAIALLFGYLPMGLGFSPLLMLPLGAIGIYAVVQFVGQPSEGSTSKASVPGSPHAAAEKRPPVEDSGKPASAAPEEDASAEEKLKQVDLEGLDVDWDDLPK